VLIYATIYKGDVKENTKHVIFKKMVHYRNVAFANLAIDQRFLKCIHIQFYHTYCSGQEKPDS
jgi:hypothetical protein